ncbi:hypothetical protein TVAG_112780 [Trichomonas vaginalis G3]|uniref:Uncharacterized protein n=1 Tax=Trichomonas vaginalis (strain ATCC PRA-98 / G3) TaxID=412133 RepID=A2F725_TRIV3|nr:hypothetical protein TVAG_112780 [Trichomonas vaginalis G3]|eukprot:XP_001312192.1 hypothetical protein [Trichomonas vaginalis G3]
MIDSILDQVEANMEPSLQRKAYLEGVINQYRELNDQIAELEYKIERENNFRENFELQRDINLQQLQKIQNEYNQTKEDLEKSAIKNAVLSSANSSTPLISQRTRIIGNTNFVQYARLQSQILNLKQIYLQKIDTLSKLRRSVYCLDNNEEFTYNEQPDLFSFQETHPDILQRMKTPLLCPKYEAGSIISSIIPSDLQNSINQENNIEFHSTSFIPKYLKSKPIDSLITSFFVNSEEQGKILQTKKQRLNDLNNQIYQLDNDRYNIINSVRINLADHLTEIQQKRFKLCSEVIFEAQKQINQAQTIVDGLNQCFHGENHEVFANDTQIKLLINDITKDVQQIISKGNRLFVAPSLTPIQFQDPPKLIIDQISTEQITRCKEKINKLNEILDTSENYQNLAIEELNEIVESLTNISKSQTTSLSNLSISDNSLNDDSDEIEKFLELKRKVLSKQKERLTDLKDMIEMLPDTVKSLEVENIPEIEESKIQKDNFMEEIEVMTPPVSDPFTDSNQVLLQKILSRKVEIKENPENVEPKTRNVDYKTGKFQSKIDSWTDIIGEGLDIDFSKEIEKRNSLEEEFSETISKEMSALETKIFRHESREKRQTKLKELRDQVDSSRDEYEQIKSFIHQSQKKIEELNEKINSTNENINQTKQETERIDHENKEYEELVSKKKTLIEEISKFKTTSERENNKILEQIKKLSSQSNKQKDK